MTTSTAFDPSLTAPRNVQIRRRSSRQWVGRLAVAVTLGGLVLVIVLGIATETTGELLLPGGVTTFIGSMTGLVGMYLALVQVLLIARIPPIEKILGQDGLVRWHRRLGPWPIVLLIAHALFVTIGYAQAARTGMWHEVRALVLSYPDVLAATVGLGLMVMIGVVSFRAVRNRIQRDTWWVIHLYIYLALALSFAHVIVLGPAFVGHPLTIAVWSIVWAATAGTVLVYRFAIPIFRSLTYRLKVAEVYPEAPGVVSVILEGRNLERLAVSGGQFFTWRFLTRGLWWQAHPYSLSALPRPPYLRLTVKAIGDHSSAVARLRPGTPVAIEGPFGAVTPHVRKNTKAVLFAGGIGITALRSLLEDLPREARPVVIMRASSENELVFKDEVAELVRRRKGVLHELVGSREKLGSTRQLLRKLVPDLHKRDVYACGPPGLIEDVVAAASSLGVPRDALHYEIFSW